MDFNVTVPKLVDAYLATLSPMHAAKARAALAIQCRHNGTIRLRYQLVERLLTEGRTIRTTKHSGRVLEDATGAFLSEKTLTKTAMDYAQFIVDQAGPLTSAAFFRALEAEQA